jgi:hypothetical protein
MMAATMSNNGVDELDTNNDFEIYILDEDNHAKRAFWKEKERRDFSSSSC